MSQFKSQDHRWCIAGTLTIACREISGTLLILAIPLINRDPATRVEAGDAERTIAE
jgi:hypothetical protein